MCAEPSFFIFYIFCVEFTFFCVLNTITRQFGDWSTPNRRMDTSNWCGLATDLPVGHTVRVLFECAENCGWVLGMRGRLCATRSARGDCVSSRCWFLGRSDQTDAESVCFLSLGIQWLNRGCWIVLENINLRLRVRFVYSKKLWLALYFISTIKNGVFWIFFRWIV